MIHTDKVHLTNPIGGKGNIMEYAVYRLTIEPEPETPAYLDLVNVMTQTYFVENGEVHGRNRVMESQIRKLVDSVPANGYLVLLDDPDRKNSYRCEIWRMSRAELDEFKAGHRPRPESQGFRTRAGSLACDSPVEYRTVVVGWEQELGRSITENLYQITVHGEKPPGIHWIRRFKQRQIEMLQEDSSDARNRIEEIKAQLVRIGRMNLMHMGNWAWRNRPGYV